MNGLAPMDGNRARIFPAMITEIPIETNNLTAEEEASLDGRHRRGDLEAANILAERNVGLVYHLAGSSCASNIPRDEAVGIGFEALGFAIHRFDPARGRLSSLVAFLFRNLCAEWRASFRKPMSIRRGALSKFCELAKAARDFRDRAGPDARPTSEALAKAAGVTESMARIWLQHSGSIVSLNEPDVDGKADVADWAEAQIIRDDEPIRDADILALREMVRNALGSLSERERAVVVAHYGLEGNEPQKKAHIGQKLGVSRARIDQIEFKAMRNLRRRLEPIRAEAREAMSA